MAASTPEERPPESVRRLAYCGVTAGECGHDAVGSYAPADPGGRARTIAGHARVTEAVVLSTCNRVEVYVSARSPDDRETALAVARGAIDAPDDARTALGRDVVAHLCRVAAGLDSEVLGEDHVLGQVSRAFESAEAAGTAGGVLSRVADAAVAAGKKVRAESDINEGTVSYGSAACDAVAERAADPDRLVVVGAGEMAESVVRAAAHGWDARVDVVNRSPAPDLPSEDGEYWPLTDLAEALDGADAVVTATGAPEAVLTPADAASLDPEVPIVDLSSPPDVAEAVTVGRPVTSLDEIQRQIDAGADRRRGAVPAAESRVQSAVERFVDRERESRAEDTIRELHREAASIRASELAQARQRVEAGEADVETVLEDFASALTSRLLAEPTAALKTAAREGDDATVAAAHDLFDIEGGDGG